MTTFHATYSYHGTRVKIHSSSCVHARLDARDHSVWALAASSLADAKDELNYGSENLKARQWKIDVCKCVAERAKR